MYIAVKWKKTVELPTFLTNEKKNLTFKNNVPFRSCILRINKRFVDNAEEFDIVMQTYNLLDRI